jgi:hypothetical protein
MMFNTTFNNNSVRVRVIGGGNRKYQEKTTDLPFPPPITPTLTIDSCKSNYHALTITIRNMGIFIGPFNCWKHSLA